MSDLELKIDQWRRAMIAAGIKRTPTLDELEEHLREEIERQTRAGTEPDAAFATAVERLGAPGVLAAEFASASAGSRHARVRAVLLVALAVQLAASAGMFFWLAGISATVGPIGLPRTPEWTLPWHAALGSIYVMAITATLMAGVLRPALGRRMMSWLNWALLPVLPFGTLLGLYGLWIERHRVRRHAMGAEVS